MVLDVKPLVAEGLVDTTYPCAQLTFSLEPALSEPPCPQTIAPSPSSSCPGQSKEGFPQNSWPPHPPGAILDGSIVVLQQ